ncbi:MAG TPA: protein kinase [Polyangiaceae bacterium]|jgi:serine/threonine-protein kinase|nr:protein kinase [Polyangiaceae bacterium]
MADRGSSTTDLAGASPPDGGERLAGDARLPALGAVIAGKYRIEGLLGRGGMGVVALARQLELDRPVAIKFLRAPLGTDPRPLQRFAREARIIACMRSEHVVRIFDFGREADAPFIVMERLRGHDLSKEIESLPLSVERAVELALHACEALGEAHSLGIVHRDVKPSNLFVAEGFGGRELLKVLDFGVSKWLTPARDVDAGLSTDGGAVGTPAFASPEQLTHPEEIDGRSDVWALGIVLYQALSGTLPFAADTIPALYSAIIGGAPTPFPAGTGVPEKLVAVVERCLRRDPNERPASMLELARDLAPFAPLRAHGIVESLATLAGPEHAAELSLEAEKSDKAASLLSTTLEFTQNTPPSPSGAEVARGRRSHRRGAWLLALPAVVFAGVVLWGQRSQAPAPSPVATSAAARLSASPPATTPRETRAPASVEPPPPSVAPSTARPKSREPTLARPTASRATAAASVPAPAASAERPSDGMPLYRH